MRFRYTTLAVALALSAAVACAATVFAASTSPAQTAVWHLGEAAYEGPSWAMTDSVATEEGTVARIAYHPASPLPGVERGVDHDTPVWYFSLISTVEVDCANQQTRRLRTDHYSRELKKMSSQDGPDAWRKLDSHDAMDAALIAECDKQPFGDGRSFTGDDVKVLKWLKKQQ